MASMPTTQVLLHSPFSVVDFLWKLQPAVVNPSELRHQQAAPFMNREGSHLPPQPVCRRRDLSMSPHEIGGMRLVTQQRRQKLNSESEVTS